MITRRRALRAVLVALALLAAGNLLRTRFAQPARESFPAPVRSTAVVPPDRALDSFAVSADGQSLAYASEAADGRLHLFVRFLGGDKEAAKGDRDVELANAIGAHDPFFS